LLSSAKGYDLLSFASPKESKQRKGDPAKLTAYSCALPERMSSEKIRSVNSAQTLSLLIHSSGKCSARLEWEFWLRLANASGEGKNMNIFLNIA